MKEKIVSFDIAKLAKEKGFDAPIGKLYSKHYYTADGKLDGDVSYHFKEMANVRNRDGKLTKDNMPEFIGYSAPTQSFLQKWLRDTHKIEVLIIRPYNFAGEPFWSYEIFIGGRYSTVASDEKEYKSYEEALEYGLLQGLNLIKQ